MPSAASRGAKGAPLQSQVRKNNRHARKDAGAAPTPRAASRSSFEEISHQDMMALPMRQYEGSIVVVATPEDLARAALDLRQEAIIGFDTETRPVFTKGQGQQPPALVQLATARAVYLLQLRQTTVLPLLAELLAAPHIIKAGVAVANDVCGLKRVFPFVESNMVDVGHAAHRHGMKQTGLRNLAGMLLGIRVGKGCRTSNWGAHTLSQQQIVYAATDAWIGRELYLDMQRRGFLVPACTHVAAVPSIKKQRNLSDAQAFVLVNRL